MSYKKLVYQAFFMFEPSNPTNCQPGKLLLPSSDCTWKADIATCSSTDSDSGCRISEEHFSSAPDTESLLTYSSCNLTASEKMDDSLSETSTILASSVWKDQQRKTNTLLSPTAKLNQHWNSNELKSTFQVPSEFHKKRNFMKFEKENQHWHMHSSHLNNPLNSKHASDFGQISNKRKNLEFKVTPTHGEKLLNSNYFYDDADTRSLYDPSLISEDHVSTSKAENLGNIPFKFTDKSHNKSSAYRSLELNVCVASSGKLLMKFQT